MTQPANGATVSGTVWPTLWVEGQSGTSNTFTVSANGQVVATQVTSSRGPVSLPWVTTTIPNGTTSLTATVRDAAGNTGTVTINVTVRN
jgi:N-acetylglutamate synthase/N-acetylornithine aminotransferase